MRSVLAIDPGNNGALVRLTKSGDFEWRSMPLKEDGKNTSVDFFGVEKILRSFLGVDMVLLERASAFNMGASGAFNYGRGFAALEIAIALLDMPVTYVEPSKWSRAMHQGISKDLKPKAKSLIAAERLYPKQFKQVPRGPISGKPHEGVIDALLIAGYGLKG